MFYLISGNDIEKVLKKINELTPEFSGERKKFSVFRFNEDNFTEEEFGNFFGASGLFFGESVVVSRGLFSDGSSSDFVFKNLRKIKESRNTFIFWEKEFGEIEKKDAAGFWNFDARLSFPPAKSGYPGFNLFKIADLLFSNRKNEAWLLFLEETLAGVPAEEIFWKLFFKVKTLAAIKKGETKNMKKYTYDKSKRSADFFDTEKLRKISFSLVDLYHKNKKGLLDLSCGIEKLILAF